MGRGRKGGAGAEADPLPQECRRGVKTTGIGSSLCLPALLGWACREMLLSPQAGRRTLSERRRFVMPGAWRMHSPGVRYRAKRGIRYPDDPCGPSLQGESGKSTGVPEKRKKPPEGGFVYPVKRAP